MSNMKEKATELFESFVKLAGMANAEEVAASEAVAEEPKTEEPTAVDTSLEDKVNEIHDFLFTEEDYTEEEVVATSETKMEENKEQVEEVKAEISEETVTETIAEKKEQFDYKAEFEAMKAELEAIKAEKNKEAEEAASFKHNPEAETHKKGPSFYQKKDSTFQTPFDKVYDVWKRSK